MIELCIPRKLLGEFTYFLVNFCATQKSCLKVTVLVLCFPQMPDVLLIINIKEFDTFVELFNEPSRNPLKQISNGMRREKIVECFFLHNFIGHHLRKQIRQKIWQRSDGAVISMIKRSCNVHMPNSGAIIRHKEDH